MVDLQKLNDSGLKQPRITRMTFDQCCFFSALTALDVERWTLNVVSGHIRCPVSDRYKNGMTCATVLPHASQSRTLWLDPGFAGPSRFSFRRTRQNPSQAPHQDRPDKKMS